MGRCTKIREREQQSCPLLSKTAPGAEAATVSISASAKTMFALLPPSSRVTRFKCSAPPAMIRLPTAVLPVKPIFRTIGCSTNRHPASGPVPTTTCKTPSGMPASSASSPSRIALNGVVSAGFKITVLPHANAGPSFQQAMSSGKFQGTIKPTTPSGS